MRMPESARSCAPSISMERWVDRLRIAGAAVVAVLAGAAGVWAVSGQDHQAATAAKIIHGLPCQATGTTHTQTGVQEHVCLYNDHKIILWTLQKGPNTIYPPGWAQTIVMGTPARWIAGCPRLDDCEAIQSTFGGDLSSGPVLGVEIIVQ